MGLMLATAVPASAQGPGKVRQLLGQGWTYLEAGNLRKAEESFTAAFEDPVGRNTAEVYYAIAAVWWERRNAMAAYMWLGDAGKASKDSFTWDGGPDNEWSGRIDARRRYIESNFTVIKLRSPKRGKPLPPLADPAPHDPLLRQFTDRLPTVVQEGVDAKVTVQWVLLPNGTYWIGEELVDLAGGQLDPNQAASWELPADRGKAKAAYAERLAALESGRSMAEEASTVAATAEADAAAADEARELEEEARRKQDEADRAARLAEQDRRLAEERAREEERRQAELDRQAQERADRDRRRAEEEQRQAAEDQRRAEERQAADQRREAEARQAEEDRRRAEELRAEEDRRRAAERQADVDRRLAEERQREADRQRAEELRRQDDLARAQERQEAEARRAEQAELAEGRRRAQEAADEEARQAAARRRDEERRRAEAEDRRVEDDRQATLRADTLREEARAAQEDADAEAARARDADARAVAEAPAGQASEVLSARRGYLALGGGLTTVDRLEPGGGTVEADWAAHGEVGLLAPLLTGRTPLALAVGLSYDSLPMASCSFAQSRGHVVALHVAPRLAVPIRGRTFLQARVGFHIGAGATEPSASDRQACADARHSAEAGTEVAYGVQLTDGAQASYGDLGWGGWAMVLGPDLEVGVLGAPGPAPVFVGAAFFLRHDQVFAAIEGGDYHVRSAASPAVELQTVELSALDPAASMPRFQVGARATVLF